MPLKLHAIEDWSRKRLVSELGSARFDFDPPMNLGSRSTYLILSSPLSSVRIACFLPFLCQRKEWTKCHSPFFPTWIKEAKPSCQRMRNGMPSSSPFGRAGLIFLYLKTLHAYLTKKLSARLSAFSSLIVHSIYAKFTSSCIQRKVNSFISYCSSS